MVEIRKITAPLGDGEDMIQPGYDVLAERYAEMFPSAYQTTIEQHAVAAFVERIYSEGRVVDVGCGYGHVTADLARRGLDAVVRPGSLVLIASQSSDMPGPATPFDHAVAPAWRWHPDELKRLLATAGFTEDWRIINRPDAVHRFPGLHLLAHRR